METSLITELDEVLKLAYEKAEGIHWDDISGKLHLSSLKDTANHEAEEMLIKEITGYLTEKKYLRLFIKREGGRFRGFLVPDAEHWAITFEGRVFLLQGAYQGQLNREKQNQTRIETLELIQMELSKQQSEAQASQARDATAQTILADRVANLTKWIALATIPVGIYSVIQIAPLLSELMGWLLHCLYHCKTH